MRFTNFSSHGNAAYFIKFCAMQMERKGVSTNSEMPTYKISALLPLMM